MKRLIALLFFVSVVFVCSSQSISTNRDIYNYDVGDIFHYEHEMYAPTSGTYITENIEISGKYFSNGQDTVFYIRDIISETAGSGIPTKIVSFTDTIFYTSFDSLINTGIIDSVFYDSTLYNGRKINRDTNSFFDLYVDSLGKVVDLIYSDPTTLTLNEKRLVYYRKGTEEWGNPVFLGFRDNFESMSVKIFPNPVSEEINIDFESTNSKISSYKIYNSQGKLVLSKELLVNDFIINIKDFASGVYFIEATTSSGERVVEKFVKQ